MSAPKKKLQLEMETVSDLADEHLAHVAGGTALDTVLTVVHLPGQGQGQGQSVQVTSTLQHFSQSLPGTIPTSAIQNSLAATTTSR